MEAGREAGGTEFAEKDLAEEAREGTGPRAAATSLLDRTRYRQKNRLRRQWTVWASRRPCLLETKNTGKTGHWSRGGNQFHWGI